ncbi:MAG: LsmAD domain-containing protein [Linnemannia elongata]|nr:MAG: LsmAD domain-containing protein [Linnemannia elongata]
MTVEITVKNGSKYEGLFHTAFTEGELGIVLRLAKAISGKDKKDNSPLISQMIVLAKDCMAINVLGVDFVPAERSGFKTDTDISRSGDIKQRDLKKWAPEGNLSYGGIEDDLGDTNHHSSASWDQFAANERLFGVRTDFDEEIYTTRLDRTGADYKAREQQAIQIAQEIQQSVSSNVHMREERGLAVDDSGLDEEDLYGAVVRDPLPTSNKYMPPAMRRQQELNQQRRPSTPVQTPARSKNQQIPEHAVDSKQIEENLAKFAMTVSTFATNDKVLVSQRKTELMQQRKAGLAAELKQFGKELTLNTPVPEDVKEIFGKKNEVAADKAKEATTTGKELDKEKTLPEVKDAKAEPAKSNTASTGTTTSTTTISTITSAVPAASTATDKPATTKPATGSSFKFNIKASEFKPNVNAAPFTPSFTGDKKSAPGASTAADKNLFFGKVIKKGSLPLQSSMASPFKKGQTTPSPASTTPTWPYGQRAFRHQFQVTNRYEDDMMYSQGMAGHNGNGAGGYYAMGPYSYGPSGQFGVPPPMTMGGPSHMVPFMGAGGPVPFSQPPPGMPHTAAGPGYPQMAPTTAPHYAPQGFPPGRSGMLPPSGMHMQMYPYPPTHGAPVMMRYPPPEMMATMGPNGMMMHQRPMGMDPQMMHYSAVGREAGLNEGTPLILSSTDSSCTLLIQ